MKIIGIGVDIVENNRFKKLIKKDLLVVFVVPKKLIILKRKTIKFYIYLKDFLLKKHLLKL